MRDVRVLEIGSSIAGAYCGRLFATQGSDVVLLEPPGKRGLRGVAPFMASDGVGQTSAVHEYLNASKRSVSLELDDAIVEELLAWADIVVSSTDGDPDRAMRFDHRVKGPISRPCTWSSPGSG